MSNSWQRVFSRGWQIMYKGYTKNLLVTNTLTCSALLTGGDYIQQRIEQLRGKSNTHDYSRSGRMAAVGLSQGPPHHYWYVWLDKLLPKKDLRSVVFKILLDQFIAAPFFAITFFYGMGILEDKRMSECWNEFLQKFPLVYAFDWGIWPPTQYINFVYIPAAFRVLYVNCVTVIWDIFLSWVKHKDQLEQEKTSSFE
eukprot:12021.XXX_625050_625827_1 [CDS] Oithona nana genome sequencing.